MIKLTPIQSRVLRHFPKDKWKSAYDMQVSMATLNALVEKGFLERRGVGTLGAHYSPRTVVEYRVCPTKRAPDVMESAASVSILPASEADSTPATTQVIYPLGNQRSVYEMTKRFSRNEYVPKVCCYPRVEVFFTSAVRVKSSWHGCREAG